MGKGLEISRRRRRGGGRVEEEQEAGVDVKKKHILSFNLPFGNFSETIVELVVLPNMYCMRCQPPKRNTSNAAGEQRVENEKAR
eukprot:498883-Hanusia_phi.AAC.1